MDSISPQDTGSATDPDEWADAPHTVDNIRFDHRGRAHYQVTVKTDAHRVTVSISPQGRSVRVWLDGIPMQEEPVEVGRYIARAVDGAR
jgi:hypothetical protein